MQISRANIRAASLSRRSAATHIYCVFSLVAPQLGARRVAEGIKKVAESLASIRIKCYLCPELIIKRMTNNSHDWVITGVDRLTGTRAEIARAATYEECMSIMDRERNKPRRVFSKLRAERLTPRQLTILIEEI